MSGPWFLEIYQHNDKHLYEAWVSIPLSGFIRLIWLEDLRLSAVSGFLQELNDINLYFLGVKYQFSVDKTTVKEVKASN